MSFSFNFNVDSDSEKCPNEGGFGKDAGKDVQNTDPMIPQILKPAEEVLINEKRTMNKEAAQRLHLKNGHVLYHVRYGVDDQKNSSETKVSSDIAEADAAQSDLVPNVYEGGLKVWESSVDLVHHLSSVEIAWRGLNVIELGCGCGLPGLYSYTQGAHVTFLDYNKEVLESITIPNVLLNTQSDEDGVKMTSMRCKFWAGDWSFVEKQLEKNKFDVILTSETIYNPDNYQKLYDIMKSLLKKSGQIYLAAKTYYFGVGGGTRDFEQLVKKFDDFSAEVVKVIEEGVQREILKLEFKDR